VTINPQVGNVRIIGFYITNGNKGVEVKVSSHIHIANCVIGNSVGDGLYVNSDYTASVVTQVEIYNNVFYRNGASGISFQGCTSLNGVDFCYANIMNNIFLQNHTYGIWGATSYYTHVGFANRVTINFNDMYGNSTASYGGHIGSGQSVVPDPNETPNAPQFVGEDTSLGIDMRLQSGSPCRHAGSESTAFNNPDGTRNDQGAYGGPYCATFFESVTDGPFVRQLSIVPGSVPQGSTFSISATAAVR